MSVICTFENEAKKIRSLTKKLCELNQYIIEEERSPFSVRLISALICFMTAQSVNLVKEKEKMNS